MDKFALVYSEILKDFNMDARVYQHIATKATVVKFISSDPNMTFSISFRTPAINDKGITHIIEHSVLCGSDNYTTKEPFADLLRVSYQNFLNAFTAPDWTMYPLSSMNKVDYENLMKIYLDAVFLPRVRKDKFPFLQEGWRWEEVAEEQNESGHCHAPHECCGNCTEPHSAETHTTSNDKHHLTTNGVVLNEMKNSETDPNTICTRAICRELYTGTYYNVSGGVPSAIETLSYAELQDFYYKHYTPSNSVTVLYSPECVLVEEFEILDHYFTLIGVTEKRACGESTPHIIVGEPTSKRECLYLEYPIGEEDDVENNDTFVCAWKLGEVDYETSFALDSIQKIVEAKEGNKFVEKLTELGIAKSIVISYDSDLKNPYFVIFAKNANGNKFDEFQKVLLEEFEEFGRNGFGREKEISAINTFEFEEKECEYGSFPKGVLLAMKTT
ncbi:hypothetical protein EIN_205180, partial [Entamoeba invadens IP1]